MSGDRFRRRALRRGYKVDEVDSFLDRVDATLDGQPFGEPVNADDVQDVVFRVRFGGYDEWEVDVHLDRVQRQLAALDQPAGGDYPSQRYDQRRGPVPPEPGRSRVETSGELRGRGPLPGNVPPLGAAPAANGRFDQPTHQTTVLPAGQIPPADGSTFRPPAWQQGAPPPVGPPQGHPPAGPQPVGQPAGPPPVGQQPGPQETPSFTYQPRRSAPEPEGYAPGLAGRHGRPEMTLEVHTMAPGSPFTRHDIERLGELRRTFTTRRFGSGYDAEQVEQLFEAIAATLHGRSGGSLAPADLDPAQFRLVSGGYFEAEVDQALREVREIIARRLR